MRPSSRGRGARWGALAGAGLGAVVGLVVGASESDDGGCDQCGLGVGVFTTMGVASGTLVGLVFSHGETWERLDPLGTCVATAADAPPRRVTVRVAPATRGVGARLAVSF